MRMDSNSRRRLCSKTEPFIRVNLKLALKFVMALAFRYGLMVQSTKETGEKTWPQVEASSTTSMEMFTMVRLLL
jgi:hypothetical protein